MTADGLQMCYTCLQDVPSLARLQEADVDDITYITKLSRLTAFKLIPQEAMGICTDCINQLRVSYEFLEMVTESQNSWKRYLDEITIRTESVDVEEGSTEESNESKSDATSKRDKDINNSLCEISNNVAETSKVESLENESNFACTNYKNEDIYVVPEITDQEKNSDNNFHCTGCSKVFSPKESRTQDCCKGTAMNEANKSNGSIIAKSKTKGKPKMEVSYKCSICETLFNKRWQLRKHMVRVHEPDKKYNCDFCGKCFKQSYHLKEHMTCHTGEKNFSCDFCGKKFQRSSSVRRHMKSHDAPPGQKTKRTPFLCNICGKNFPFSNGVQRHMRVHLGIKKHECQICHKTFRQSTHLHVHMRIHTGEKPYICDTCGESFSLKARLLKHISILHDCDVKSECEPKNDSDAKSKCYHRSECEPKNEPRCESVYEPCSFDICGYCGENFGNNVDLQFHIESFHKSCTDIQEFNNTSEKPYNCDTCGESFSLEARLLKHISISHDCDVKSECEPESDCDPKGDCDLKNEAHLRSECEPKNEPRSQSVYEPCSFDICGYCGENFGNNVDLQFHIESFHKSCPDIKEFNSEDLRNYQIFPDEIPKLFYE